MLTRLVFYRVCCLVLVAQGLLVTVGPLQNWAPSRLGETSHAIFLGTHVLLVLAAGLCYVLPRRNLGVVIAASGLAWTTYLWTAFGSGVGLAAVPPDQETLFRFIVTIAAIFGMGRSARSLVPERGHRA